MGILNKKDKDEKKKAKKVKKQDSASGGAELAKSSSGSLLKASGVPTVGGLEESLLAQFPPATAEPWDRMGLLVGAPSLPISNVAVCLDPTVSAIREAASCGANVLVTHHPAFLEPPTQFQPENSTAQCSGAGVFAAIQYGVALINVHTALDASTKAQKLLPMLLGFAYSGDILSPLPQYPSLGYGQISTVPQIEGVPESLAHVAARCTAVFGRAPRVWGNLDAQIKRVVTATGSANGLGVKALKAGVDCLICGEIKYHEALELATAGLTIIELGHDVSELPLTTPLADAVAAYGIDPANIIILDQSRNWVYPETIRL